MVPPHISVPPFTPPQLQHGSLVSSSAVASDSFYLSPPASPCSYPPSPVSPALSDITVVDMFSPGLTYTEEHDGDDSAKRAKAWPPETGYRKLALDDEDDGGSQSNRNTRRHAYDGQRLSHFALLGLLVAVAFALGWSTGRGSASIAPSDAPHPAPDYDPHCDPYSSPLGVLNVSLTVASENVWQPNSGAECQPIDYMSLIREAQAQPAAKEAPDVELLFARGRTVVLVGDSIDRGHAEHFCAFVNGNFEMIGDSHPLSPPYPVGKETPLGGDATATSPRWNNYDQSRPHVCHIPSLNLRIVNVFIYGFQDDTPWIRAHTHYYPPAELDDRIDQILVPLLTSLAESTSTSPVPTLISLSPTFWTIYRQAVQDDQEHNGEVYRSMPPEVREWNEEKVERFVKRIAGLWKGEGERGPGIIWRSLHHVRDIHEIPNSRIASLDSLSRSTVLRLQRDSVLARTQDEEAWTASGRSEAERKELLDLKLEGRLKVDEWGARMTGMERYFKDQIHPLPVPGSYLYGNMLMWHLRWAVDGY